MVIRDNCLSRQGGVAAEPLRHVVSGGTCDVTRRLLWWISLNLVVLAAAGASTRGADSRRPGAAPPFAFFFFLLTFFDWPRRSHAVYCSRPPPRGSPKLRIVLWSPTLGIYGQGRLSSQPRGRARSHALSPAGCSPSLREPRGGRTLSLSGLTRGFIGWFNAPVTSYILDARDKPTT